MFKLAISAVTAAALIVSTSVHAQYTYNWSSGEEGDQVIRAARVASLTVTGLNTICYDFQVHAQVTDEKPVLTGLQESFSPPKTTESSPAPGIAAQATVTGSHTRNQVTGPAILRELGLTKSTSTEDDILAKLAIAETALEAASPELERLEVAIRRAEYYLNLLQTPPCDRGFDARSLFETWSREREPLANQIAGSSGSFDDIRAALRSAGDALAITDPLANALPASDSKAVILRRLAMDRHRLEEFNSRVSSLTESLPRIQAQFPGAASQIDARATASTKRVRADLGPDAASIKLTISGSERQPPEGKTARAVDESITIGVRRKYQSFLSTGLLVTFQKPHDYARVNRPFAQGDSTYSTYANQAGGLLNVFSPALQYNIAVADFADAATGGRTFGMPLYLSMGAAGRSVNGHALPEPFAGLSFGVADRLLLTFGVHYGRDEVLLIRGENETDGDVEARRVPSAVTDKDAIGERWQANGFLSFSVRF